MDQWTRLSASPATPSDSPVQHLPASPLTFRATIEVPAELAQAIAADLEAAEPQAPRAVTLFERAHGRIEIAAYYDQEPQRAQLLEMLRQVGASGPALDQLSIDWIADRDWVREAEALRGPVRAGRFLVHGRHDRNRIARGRYTLEIDAGLAFGTGQHASTKGCLLALDRILKRQRFRTVIDIGTGTGILAIAAAKAARAEAIASDLDPPVVAAAYENVRLSGVASLVRVIEAAGLRHPQLRHWKVDLLFANLLLNPLLELAPSFARALRTGGYCVLSGLLASQAPQVEARFRTLGFDLSWRVTLDGWTTLVLVRRNPAPVRD